MIKYSVIIPGLNIEKHEPNLSGFVKKILALRNDIEFILVDDGSTDDTYKKYSELNIFNIYRQSNHGVSHARNKGMSLAKGKYILFLDADDSYDISIFEHLDNELDNEAELLIFNYSITNIVFDNPTIKKYYNNQEILSLFFSRKIKIHICSICFNSSFLKNNGVYFPEGYSFGEDIYFIIKSISFATKEITYIPNKLFHYHLENSNTVKTTINENKIKVLELYTSLYNEKILKDNNQYFSYFLQRTLIYLIKLSFKNGISNKNVIDALKLQKRLLNEPLKIKTPISFKMAKFVINNFNTLIFHLLRLKITHR
ncbi:glycosyltransferase family 2 protein [Escherichia coli]|uniref:glycosyltransferase family 2 protein n=1 Tax=Escherichia coli TaxID=562 RepID=UPI00068EC56B|nr:glycosyltransferase family 2 protein [Escherichia coli]